MSLNIRCAREIRKLFAHVQCGTIVRAVVVEFRGFEGSGVEDSRVISHHHQVVNFLLERDARRTSSDEISVSLLLFPSVYRALDY